MTVFIPINYRNKQYPDGITCPIQEIAGHLDKISISPKGPYSLHTEYSYGKRKLSSSLLKNYSSLQSRHINGVPQLWYDNQWATEFADFLIELVTNHQPPTVIEIHPPFKDYCPTIPEFFERYTIFERIILDRFPEARICLENRSGTIYKGRSFLISSMETILDFLQTLAEQSLQLRLVLDYPQLFTAEHYDLEDFPMEKFIQSHKLLNGFQPYIQGIHIWGKRKNKNDRWVAHCGDLNSLFADNLVNKESFLKTILDFYNDDSPRFLVPEVNSSASDLQSIINDFTKTGAKI